jgi:major membrane immunogen (membrane-anchored lipoprotein)
MRRIILMILAAFLIVSCGSSKKAAQKPAKTVVQPGADLLGAPDVLRAWAVGVSDSQMTAKKKAMAAASSELAQMLNSVVKTTIDDYCVALSDGESVEAKKEFLSRKCSIVSEQLLVGVRPVFDQLEMAGADGKYRNYVVLELSAEEFIKRLSDSIGQMQDAKNVDIDTKLLNDIFIKKVNSGK